MYITVVVPSAPTNLIGISLTTSISLTWTQALLDVVDTYTIRHSQKAGCGSAPSGSKNVPGSPTSYIQEIVENVKKNT